MIDDGTLPLLLTPAMVMVASGPEASSTAMAFVLPLQPAVIPPNSLHRVGNGSSTASRLVRCSVILVNKHHMCSTKLVRR